MLVQDLNYMEEVSEASTIEGGYWYRGDDQFQYVDIDQYATAYAGIGKYNYGNTAIAFNVANVVQADH